MTFQRTIRFAITMSLSIAAGSLVTGGRAAAFNPHGESFDEPPPREGPDGPRPRPAGDDPFPPGPPRDGPEGGFHRPFDDGPMGAFPPELADRIMEVLKERLPRLHERMDRLRERNPRLFDRAMRRLVPFFKEYMALRQRAPELAESIVEEFQAEERLRALARDYEQAKSDPNRQVAIAREIESLVRRQFELRHRRHAARLEDFARRIQDQQAELARRREEFQRVSTTQDELISRRVEQIKSGRMPEGPPIGAPPIGDRPRRGGGRPGGPDDAPRDRMPPPHGPDDGE